MPLVEAVSSSGYNIKTLIGLGAPTAYIKPGIVPAVLIKLISAVVRNALSAATSLLSGIGVGYYVNSIAQVTEIIMAKLREIVQQSNVNNESFPYTLSEKTELIVNVWGTEDVFYKDIGVVGKRDNFFGKPTYNIEIVGATHTDYIRGTDPANPNMTWNNTVASFVTDLMLSSSDANKLDLFILDQKNKGIILPPDARGVYIVRLPGCGISVIGAIPQGATLGA